MNSSVSRVAKLRGRGRSISTISSMRPGSRAITGDPVGQQDRLADAVGDEQDGLARGRPDALQLDIELIARDRVERAERLVHQEQCRIVEQRPADRRALAHAARQLPRIAMRERAQPERVEHGERRLGRTAWSACGGTRAAAAHWPARCASRAACRAGTRCRDPRAGPSSGPVLDHLTPRRSRSSRARPGSAAGCFSRSPLGPSSDRNSPSRMSSEDVGQRLHVAARRFIGLVDRPQHDMRRFGSCEGTAKTQKREEVRPRTVPTPRAVMPAKAGIQESPARGRCPWPLDARFRGHDGRGVGWRLREANGAE